MTQFHFADELTARVRRLGTPCIAGIDPDIALVSRGFRQDFGAAEGPAGEVAALSRYNAIVIDAVHDLVAAVKLQSAYYEVYGVAGAELLATTIAHARSRGLLVILDAKRGDIGSTSRAYAQAYLAREPARDHRADCMTLSPYLGDDGLQPFVDACADSGAGVFVCVLNSNPGAIRLQTEASDGAPLYERVATIVRELGATTIGDSGFSLVGSVVGATTRSHAARVRELLPQSMFLVPGLGAQGGDPKTIAACFNDDGLGAIVSGSRSIMYPSRPGSRPEEILDGVRAAMLDAIATVGAAVRVKA